MLKPLKLFIFPPCWGMPSPSPFCVKVEAYLKMADISYEPVYLTDPREAPKGKLPYIEIEREQNQKIADSYFIIKHLEAAQLADQNKTPLDAHLSAEQKAISHATQHMLDEHLAWVVIYSRWVSEKNFKIIKNTFFSNIPAPMRLIASKKVRKYMLNALNSQGVSRHQEDEVYQLGKEDVSALSMLLGNKYYFFGDKPSTLDATAYAYIASIIHVPMESPLKRFVLDQSNLVDFCERIDEQYFKNS